MEKIIKGQSRPMSVLEIILSTLIGYIIAVTMQEIVFPKFGLHVTLLNNLKLGALFTIVSVIRGYIFRRIFNYIQVK